MSPEKRQRRPLVPYIRQSRKREETISLDDQRAMIQRWASANGYKLAPEIVEPGVSGSKPWRERELGTAIAAVEAGQAAGIIVAYQSRLSRENGAATGEMWDALAACDARLVIAEENRNYKPSEDDDGEMFYAIQAAIARREWKRHRANWAKGRRNAVERGVHPAAWVPTGYQRTVLRMHPDTGKPIHGPLAVDPAVAPVIKELFRLRAARPRGSWTECARLLEEAGVPNRQGQPYWTRRAVQRIIQNPAFTGQARHGDFVKEGAHPALVDPALWRRAQSEPGKRTRGSEGALLAGILHCAACGRRMTPSLSDGRYRCRSKIIAGEPCDAPATAKASEIEPLVVRDFLGAVAWRPIAPAPPNLEPYEAAVTQAKAAYDVLLGTDLLTIDPAAFNEKAREGKARIEAAEDALAEARESAGLNDERLTLPERWAEMSIPEQRRTLGAFGVEVHVRRAERGREIVVAEGREEEHRRKESIEDRAVIIFQADKFRPLGFEPEVVVEAEEVA